MSALCGCIKPAVQETSGKKKSKGIQKPLASDMIKSQRNYGEDHNTNFLEGMGISLEDINIGVGALQKQ